MFRVLLADDEKMPLVSTTHSFPWKAYQFYPPMTTTDPRQALKWLQEQRFDVAFLDIRMPELSGYDLIKAYQENDFFTKFVMVTGYSDFENTRQAIHLEAFDYVLKPVQAKEADDLLKRLVPALLENRITRDLSFLQSFCTAESFAQQLEEVGIDSHSDYYSIFLVEGYSPLKNDQPNTELEPCWFALSENKFVGILATEEDKTQKIIGTFYAEGKTRVMLSTTHVTKQGQNIHPFSKSIESFLSKVEPFAMQKENLLLLPAFSLEKSNPAFLNLLRDVDCHFDQDLNLRLLAQRYNLSYSYVSELFPQVVGNTFTAYTAGLKLEKARELLVNTSQSVEDIGYLVGYQSPQYFSRVFKEYFGQSPSGYRKQQREE